MATEQTTTDRIALETAGLNECLAQVASGDLEPIEEACFLAWADEHRANIEALKAEQATATPATRFDAWTTHSLIERAALETFSKGTHSAGLEFLAEAGRRIMSWGKAYAAYKAELAAMRAERIEDTGSDAAPWCFAA